MKTLLSLLTALLICTTIHAQEVTTFRQQVQANYLTEFSANGNRYGLSLGYDYQLYATSSEWYRFLIGAFDECFIKDERDIDGITGTTLSNQLGLSLTNQFRFLNKRQLYLNISPLVGWGFRRTSANYTNPAYQIDRDRESSYQFLALGVYWAVGYQLNEQFSLQAIGKTDLSRLISAYAPTAFERPGFLYGVGLTYRF